MSISKIADLNFEKKYRKPRVTVRQETARIARNAAFDLFMSEKKLYQNFLKRPQQSHKKKNKPLPPAKSTVISVAIPRGALKKQFSASLRRQAVYTPYKGRVAFKNTAIVSEVGHIFSPQKVSELDNGLYELLTFAVNQDACPPNPDADNQREREGIKLFSEPIRSMCSVYDGHFARGSNIQDVTGSMTSLFRMLARHDRATKLAISTLPNGADMDAFPSIQKIPAELFAHSRTLVELLVAKIQKPLKPGISVYEFS